MIKKDEKGKQFEVFFKITQNLLSLLKLRGVLTSLENLGHDMATQHVHF